MSEYEIILSTVSPTDEVADRDALLIALGRTPEEWAWWRANPDGLCLGVARAATGRIQSAIVGLRHRARLVGEGTHFLEIVDVFNDFGSGTGLNRAKAYLELGRAYAAEFGGRMPDGHPLVYGVPNRRAHRIGLKYHGYEILRSENLLSIPPDGIAPAPTSGAEIEEVESFPAGMADVFARAMEGVEAVSIRDAERLQWRFASHPARPYRIAIARHDGKPTGYAVYRRHSWEGERGLLCDWMVPAGDGESRHALLAWAADCVRADGLDALTVLFSDMSREWSLFQELGFRAGGTHDYLVFRSFQKPYVMSWLFEHWSYTLSDTQRC